MRKNHRHRTDPTDAVGRGEILGHPHHRRLLEATGAELRKRLELQLPEGRERMCGQRRSGRGAEHLFPQ